MGGCNCGKRKPVSQSPDPATDAQARAMRDPVVPAAAPRPVGMPTKTSGKTQTWALIAPDGSTVGRGSRLEMEAQRVRAQGGTIVPT